MKKTILRSAALLTAALCLGGICELPARFALAAAAVTAQEIVASGECGKDGDNLTWSLDDEGTLTIYGEGEMADWNVPSELPWYENRDKVKSVKLLDGVTSIGGKAFEDCTSLTSITIPDSVTSIRYSAFYYCTSLTSIAIPNSVTSIGYCVFGGTSLTSITIPNSVTSIDVRAFESCSNLTEITIPDSVTSIGGYAFEWCSNLTAINISDRVTSIGGGAFNHTPWLKSKQEENPLVIVNNILLDGTTCSGNVTIPTGVTSIGEIAFCGCTALTNIIIPDSVTSIEDIAFSACEGLTSITIPDSVTRIGCRAFSGCFSLTDITIKNPNCVIYDSKDTICNSFNIYDYSRPFTGTIHGYAGSTAEAYATKYGRNFEALPAEAALETGDLDGDGEISVTDAQNVLLAAVQISIGKDTGLTDAQLKAADVNGDGQISVADAQFILNYYVQNTVLGANVPWSEITGA